MESSALFANIALIITKDLLNDKTTEPVKPFYHLENFEDDDEAESYYLQNHQQRTKSLKPVKKCLIKFLNQFDSQTFENFIHMSKPTFLQLFEGVRNHLSNNAIPTHMAFFLAIWKMCRDEHFEEIARRFNLNLLECQMSIRQVWNLIFNNERCFIKWPSQDDLNAVSPIGPIGVIALKRLDIFLESNDQEVQVVWQIVCNKERKILDCYVQSLQDYDFDESPILKIFQSQTPTQHQKYLIGNGNFPLRNYLLIPFTHPDSEEEFKFNSVCEKYLAWAQNTFDSLAKQFNTLYALESKDLIEVRRIISCICCFHNLCVDINDEYIQRQQDTIKSVNWSKPMKMENCHYLVSQEAINRRNDLIKEVIHSETQSKVKFSQSK